MTFGVVLWIGVVVAVALLVRASVWMAKAPWDEWDEDDRN
ncbi:hypothetical protein Wenmar_01623 [Wenxinia marina DSM 24838]|uniref:Uncharacterized protein n=1 Tax=Wenxinia marina DSM 24838 TaxID=1123501 RepID=A0A0D0QG88_9RHOB|nr:hypothetical protein Wenmar_01623 [Wenxinia marina DSM 24838]